MQAFIVPALPYWVSSYRQLQFIFKLLVSWTMLLYIAEVALLDRDVECEHQLVVGWCGGIVAHTRGVTVRHGIPFAICVSNALECKCLRDVYT